MARTKDQKRRTDLVAGILFNKGRFLVEKRRMDKEADPGYVEIPGGHVELGETLEGALRREMKEELGITPSRKRDSFERDLQQPLTAREAEYTISMSKSGKEESGRTKLSEYIGNLTSRISILFQTEERFWHF